MRRWTTTLAFVGLMTLSTAAMACPMCKDSIPNADGGGTPGGPPSTSLPGGFNSSVYTMLIGFLGTLGFISYTIVNAIRTTPNRPVRGFEVLGDRKKTATPTTPPEDPKPPTTPDGQN